MNKQTFISMGRLAFVFLVGAWALASLPAQAKGVFYPCYRTPAPPVIDGRIEEGEWGTSERIEFADIVTGARAGAPTFARMMWDETALYFAFNVPETNIWALITQRDAPKLPEFKTYTENFIKIFLDPDGDARNYTEMHFSPASAIDDKWQSLPWRPLARTLSGLPLDSPVDEHWEWNCPGLRHAVALQGTLNNSNDTDHAWTLEVAIPFSAMKQFAGERPCPPRADEIWRIHLGRRFQEQADSPTNAVYWTWPVVGERDCHRPDTWGYLVFVDACRPASTTAFERLPKASFKWKMLWVRPNELKTPADVERTLSDAQRMGFNVIAAAPVTNLAAAVHGKGMKYFAWMINLEGKAAGAFAKAQPEFAQQVRPVEKSLVGTPRIDPDRETIYGGNWLCPDRGLLDVERAEIEAFMRIHGADGLALDYIGYRNYYACFCAHSQSNRAAFAREHSDLSPGQVMWKHSESALVTYCRQVREAVRAIKPDAELAIHIYPDFDPDPTYANRFPVEYCGQTIAWFYKPFWSYGTVAGLTAQYKAAQGRFEAMNRFVPFVGAYGKVNTKTPEQLRTEIRIAGSSGTGAIMLAFYETFLNDPALAAVVAEELSTVSDLNIR